MVRSFVQKRRKASSEKRSRSQRNLLWSLGVIALVSWCSIALNSKNGLTQMISLSTAQQSEKESSSSQVTTVAGKSDGVNESRGIPYISFPKGIGLNGTPNNNYYTEQYKFCTEWKTTTRYSPRFFLGGAKAGSTGMWETLLAGVPLSGKGPTASDYIGLAQEYPNQPHTRESGKEICFGGNRFEKTIETWESFFEPSSPVSRIGLDCCPLGTEKERICALWELFHCEIMFLLLVRDPTDRALSWFNDRMCSRELDPTKVDSYTVPFVETSRIFQLADILHDALFECGVDPRAILIVDTDGLKQDQDIAQQVMDAVNDHYGLPRMINTIQKKNTAARQGAEPDLRVKLGKHVVDRHMHAKLSDEARRKIFEKTRNETLVFLDMLEHPQNVLHKSV